MNIKYEIWKYCSLSWILQTNVNPSYFKTFLDLGWRLSLTTKFISVELKSWWNLMQQLIRGNSPLSAIMEDIKTCGGPTRNLEEMTDYKHLLFTNENLKKGKSINSKKFKFCDLC